MGFIKKVLWFFLYSFYSWFILLWNFNSGFIIITMAYFIFRNIDLYAIFLKTYVIWMASAGLTVRSIIWLSLSFLLVFSRVLFLGYRCIMVVWILKSSYLLCVWRNVGLFFVRLCYYKIWNIMVGCLGLFRLYLGLVLKLVFEQSS